MDYSLCTLILLLYVTHDHGLASPATAAAAGRILLLPFEHLAHERYFSVAGRALRRAGHEVHLLLARPRPFLTRDFPDLTHIVPRGLKTPSVFDGDVDFVNLMFANGGDPMKVSGIVAQNSLARCKEILTQEDIMNTMETARYDLVIVDGLEPASCYYIIPYRLGVKYITLTPRANPWAAAVPALPSVEPVWGATLDPANSTVTERALNLLQYLKQYLFLPPVIFSDDLISQYAPEKPPTSFRELYRGSEMFLQHQDPVCLDFHRISAPHYQFIEGLIMATTESVPVDIQQLLDSSSHGVVLVSFGSAITQLPVRLLSTFISAFAETKSTVIMQQSNVSDTLALPPNVHLFPWLPQAAVLAHPNTRLMVGHGGNNGQLEAVYHGVPMVTLPVGLDQKYNAYRVELRGYGITLDYVNLTRDDLLTAVNHVLTTPSYRLRVSECAAVMRSLPPGSDKLVGWVEHVLAVGGAHLKPRYFDMPLYKIFMLDAVMLLAVCLSVCLAAVWLLFRRYCCRKRKTKYE